MYHCFIANAISADFIIPSVSSLCSLRYTFNFQESSQVSPGNMVNCKGNKITFNHNKTGFFGHAVNEIA